MKGPPLLALLLVLATATGVLLVTRNDSDGTAGPDAANADSPQGRVADFVARELDLAATPALQLKRVPTDVLVNRIEQSLEGELGKEDLALRARAFSLLHLLPEAQDLTSQWAHALASGRRGFADGQDASILIDESFQLDDPGELGRLAYLVALARFEHEANPSFDPFLARWATRGGVASEIESRFRAHAGGLPPLPSQAEIEHEAFLLSLPLYTHNLVQLPLMQGRDYVRRRLASGESLDDIAATPPASTLALLSPPAEPGPPPGLPPLSGVELEDSLGAYSTSILCERLGDYEDAEALGPAWRGDRFALFQSGEGEHVLWITRWASPDHARKMAGLLTRQITPDDPAGRFRRVRSEGTTVQFANCADQFTLDEVLPPSVPSSQPSP